MYPAPRYKELKVGNLWSFVKEIPDLLAYFPDYQDKELPEREFLFTIISTLHPDATKHLIQEARLKRAQPDPATENELIHIHPRIRDEILGVVTQKGKQFIV